MREFFLTQVVVYHPCVSNWVRSWLLRLTKAKSVFKAMSRLNILRILIRQSTRAAQKYDSLILVWFGSGGFERSSEISV